MTPFLPLCDELADFFDLTSSFLLHGFQFGVVIRQFLHFRLVLVNLDGHVCLDAT